MNSPSDVPRGPLRCKPRSDPVIKPSTLDQIAHDIQTTTIPSWLGRLPPKMFRGTLGNPKADQWRNACTIFLPIALIKAWSREEATPNERLMLDNFMNLVMVVDAASRRSLSKESIHQIKRHLDAYLVALPGLFPYDNLKPNHHASLHIPEGLSRFGPMHGWWTYPFERLNGLLQQFRTNNRFGKLEL